MADKQQALRRLLACALSASVLFSAVAADAQESVIVRKPDNSGPADLASGANQTATQATPGSDAAKAQAAQGCTGCKPIATTSIFGNFTPSQVSVGATATQIVAARTGRGLLTVTNSTATAIYLGGSGVTTSSGQLLPGTIGASITIPYSGSLYGIVASGSATVTVFEIY